jgi:uncharacterized protein (TIGR02611 family)
VKPSDLKRGWARWRDRLRERRGAEFVYRIAVAVLGVAVLAVGIVAIPYPGPGWAIFFVGLGILATEFEWAGRLLKFGKVRYDAVLAWFKRQGPWVKVVGVVFSTAVAAVTLWLFGVLGWVAGLLALEWVWLTSPIALGS